MQIRKNKNKADKIMKKAFTLIELAIVLIIIGLLIGGSVSIYSILTKRAKVKESENIIKENTEIVKNFVSLRKKLPDNNEFDEIAKTKEDIWGKKLSYKYAPNLTDKNSICYENSTPLEIKICKNSSCSDVEETIKNVAFLILSSGENLNNQTDLSNNTIKIYLPGVKVDDNKSDTDNPSPYDDIVRWVKLDELKNITDCEEEKIHILNKEIPYGYEGESYKAKIYAEGGLKNTDGSGNYKWCYEGKLPAGLNADPDYHSNDCLNSLDFWKNADYFQIKGTPSESGNFKITVFVADKNNNIDKHSFALTVNPASSSGSSGGSGGGGSGGGGPSGPPWGIIFPWWKK